MATERKSREWWRKTVGRWKSGGLTAEEFASKEGVNASTLRWWSSRASRGTRAAHGSIVVQPIEIAMPGAGQATSGGIVEVAVAGMVVRVEVGTDVAYVAELLRAVGGG
jgi:hypothetical protein